MRFDASSLQSFSEEGFSEEVSSVGTSSPISVNDTYLEHDMVVEDVVGSGEQKSVMEAVVVPTSVGKVVEQQQYNINLAEHLTVSERATGTVGRLLMIQIKSSACANALKLQLSSTVSDLAASHRRTERAEKLIDIMRIDYRSMLDNMNDLKKKNNENNESNESNENNENNENNETKGKEMSRKIKTLQFENEIVMQEMNEQRLALEEDMEEMSQELQSTKTQMKTVVAQYTAALQKALARNSDLSKQLAAASN